MNDRATTAVFLNPATFLRGNLASGEHFKTDQAEVHRTAPPSLNNVLSLFSVLECFCLYDSVYLPSSQPGVTERKPTASFNNVAADRAAAQWGRAPGFGCLLVVVAIPVLGQTETPQQP